MRKIKKEKAVLIFAYLDKDRTEEEYIEKELKSLVTSCGGEAKWIIRQYLDKYSPKTLIGKGKVEELKDFIQKEEVDLVVFDQELSPSQMEHLRKTLEVKVLDRMALILDIFAIRARTYRSKLEVKLAQLEYRLPRLKGIGIELSRLAGGIGTRGPGESQLESDRRSIRQEMTRIKEKLKKVRIQEENASKQRRSSDMKVVSLLGYTNVGKSTILNSFMYESKKKVYADDLLFATLDVSLRRVEEKGYPAFLMADTIGFIRDLPKRLEDAFRSTLEEIQYSDLLIYVVDSSHPYYKEQIQNVLNLTKDVYKDQKRLFLMNKWDKGEVPLITDPEETMTYSSFDPTCRKLLLERITHILYGEEITEEILLPYAKIQLLSYLKNEERLISYVYQEEGIKLTYKRRKEERSLMNVSLDI